MSSLTEFTEVAESVSDDDDEVEFDAVAAAAAVATEMASAEEGPISPPFDEVMFESDARQ